MTSIFVTAGTIIQSASVFEQEQLEMAAIISLLALMEEQNEQQAATLIVLL